MVGGCVRDLLLKRRPKDFDIATSARPEEVRRLFKNCRLIGKRFRLAHILFGNDIIEVATFRTHHDQASETQGKTHADGMIIRDNVYGTIEDDVWRRDFTANSLYYNIADFSVVDYTGGMQDIQNKTLRIIGDPEQRFNEDPVRLLRAARFLGKLSFQPSPETETALQRFSHLLKHVSSARLFQEVLKFFQEGALVDTFALLKKYHLLEQLFPQTAACLNQPETAALLAAGLHNTDQRLQQGKSASPTFLLTVFLWCPIQQHLRPDLPPYVALEQSLQIVLKSQAQQLAIPRKFLITIREICILQHFFTQRHGTRPFRALEHPRFRAAYDLLLLRAAAGEPVAELATWWTDFHVADPAEQEKLLKNVTRSNTSQKKSRSKKPKKKKNCHPSPHSG